MRAGKLRKLATIQQSTTSPSAMGQPVETFTAWATVWASLEYDSSGTEAYEAVQRVGKTGARIVVRYRPGYVAGMRAVIDDQVFKIDSVGEVKPRNEVHLTCTLLQPRSGPAS